MKIPASFVSLSRNKMLRPLNVARVQTDGSFNRHNNCISRTAVILNTPKNEEYKLCTTYFNHQNSTEAEWCSVQDGIIYSLKKDCGAIELENDNLGVMTSLLEQKKPTQPYLADYYEDILQLANHMEWLSIRWIPRRYNRADDLFRV